MTMNMLQYHFYMIRGKDVLNMFIKRANESFRQATSGGNTSLAIREEVVADSYHHPNYSLHDKVYVYFIKHLSKLLSGNIPFQLENETLKSFLYRRSIKDAVNLCNGEEKNDTSHAYNKMKKNKRKVRQSMDDEVKKRRKQGHTGSDEELKLIIREEFEKRRNGENTKQNNIRERGHFLKVTVDGIHRRVSCNCEMFFYRADCDHSALVRCIEFGDIPTMKYQDTTPFDWNRARHEAERCCFLREK